MYDQQYLVLLQAVLQQAGLANPALLPTILQGLQQQTSGSGSSTNTEAMHLAAAMMNAQSVSTTS